MNYLKIVLSIATIFLSGCAVSGFNEDRFQENKIFISYNTHEVRILEINGNEFPKFSPFAANAIEVSSGFVKLKVKLHWVDTYVGATYKSPIIKELCFNTKPGYSYYIKSEVLYGEGNNWNPIVEGHEGLTVERCH